METITKDINTIGDVREAYKCLSKKYIINYAGFMGKLIFKVNLRTPKGKYLLIDYTFKSSYLYLEFKHHLRKLLN